MYEDFSAKLAHLVTSYSQPVKPGQLVHINGSVEATPLVEALFEAILRRGGHPIYTITLDSTSEMLVGLGNDDQVRHIDPRADLLMNTMDITYNIWADANPKAGNSVDPKRMALRQAAYQHLSQKFMQRQSTGELGWTVLPFPTTGMAQEAEMSLRQYTQFVYAACGLGEDDPVAYWQAFDRQQQAYVDYLTTKRELRITGPDIDLTVGIAGRTWINSSGQKNLPDGEIFTGPLEDTINGHINFNVRAVYGGREVNGIRLVWHNGRVVEASAAKGEDYLLSQLDMDAGARSMGEFAIGTNFHVQQVTGNPLFDEKIGGTIHMAVGASYPDTGGKNVSSVHWDMVHNMAHSQMYADGELFYQNGQFVI